MGFVSHHHPFFGIICDVLDELANQDNHTEGYDIWTDFFEVKEVSIKEKNGKKEVLVVYRNNGGKDVEVLIPYEYFKAYKDEDNYTYHTINKGDYISFKVEGMYSCIMVHSDIRIANIHTLSLHNKPEAPKDTTTDENVSGTKDSDVCKHELTVTDNFKEVKKKIEIVNEIYSKKTHPALVDFAINNAHKLLYSVINDEHRVPDDAMLNGYKSVCIEALMATEIVRQCQTSHLLKFFMGLSEGEQDAMVPFLKIYKGMDRDLAIRYAEYLINLDRKELDWYKTH